MIVKRNNFIDILRVVCVIIVFIYHLGYIEAGFLAVCCFFTISGYLFSKTINSNNFNLKIYYLKRLKALYLPLVIVTLLTVITFRYFIDIPWVTIKQETLSVLLGYNNFYQIKANSNYFMRSDASPFTHMWYIAVLIQIEFIFPLIALMFKKTSLKFKKTLLIIITILSTSAFVIINNIYGFAFNYYHTLSRIFSFLIGCCTYYISLKNPNKFKTNIFLLLIISMFLLGKFVQVLSVPAMIVISILTGLYILESKDLVAKEYELISLISKISYIFYLVQFPVIYIINQLSNFNTNITISIEVLITFLISIILTFALNVSKEKSLFRKLVFVLIILISLFGLYSYITCPDYYKEMEILKEQLEENQKALEAKQNEYLQNIQSQNKVLIVMLKK